MYRRGIYLIYLNIFSFFFAFFLGKANLWLVWSKKGPLTTFFLPFIHIFKSNQLQLCSKRTGITPEGIGCFSIFFGDFSPLFFCFLFFSKRFLCKFEIWFDTVDGWNPAPPRMMIIPIIYRVLTIPGGCLGFQPSTVSQFPEFVLLWFSTALKSVETFGSFCQAESSARSGSKGAGAEARSGGGAAPKQPVFSREDAGRPGAYPSSNCRFIIYRFFPMNLYTQGWGGFKMFFEDFRIISTWSLGGWSNDDKSPVAVQPFSVTDPFSQFTGYKSVATCGSFKTKWAHSKNLKKSRGNGVCSSSIKK